MFGHVAKRAGRPARTGRSSSSAELASRRLTQLHVLNEIARIATSGLELRPTLHSLCAALAAKFGWEFVACVSIDGRARRFVCEAVVSQRPTEITAGYSRPLGSGVVGEVAMTGRPILLDDVTESANYVETLPGARSELCVPVIFGGEVIAVLN